MQDTDDTAAGTATHGGGASDRHVLLSTKLHMPGPRAGLVARPRLATRLEEGAGSGLVLVVAPAGYGKTVLLAEWARTTRHPIGWLSLDTGDNDPARFWRHVLAALDRIRPGLDERVGPLLGPPAPAGVEGIVTALINDLAAGSAEDDAVLLVLDDFHAINAEAVHASLGYLLDHRPPGLRLVLASRSDPPLGLARMRARGVMTEVRSGDLRFTLDEARALLHEGTSGSGTALSDAMVEALATRTEGWAAGLQLAALSLRGQPDVGAFIEAFTGSHRYVLDYLAEEVLERQTDDMREFLLETSVLERLSGPLCDVVTGRGDSQARLEAVDAAGLFLVALDDVRGWWRYHHLFADLLRVRLKQQTDRTARLHRAAAAWYEEQGLTDDAIHHTLEGGETVWAARLIEEHFDTLFNLRGEEATIRRWLPALPRDLVSRRPRLLLAQAQMAAMRGDVDTMEPLVDAAERSAGHAPGDPYEPTAGRSASLLVNVPAVMALQRSYIAQLRGDAEATAEHTARAAALVNPDELMLLSAVEGFRGVSEWLRGNLDAAERTFASSIGRWRSAGQVTTAAWGAYSLARLQRAQGRLDAVVRTCRQALEFSSTTDGALLPAAGPAFVGLGQVEYQRDHLDAALDHVTTGVTLSRQFVHTPPLAAGLITLAWIHQATGDRATALGLVREAEGLAPGPPGLLNPVPAQRARLMLAQGALAEVEDWVRACGLGVDDDPAFPAEADYLVLARLLLAQDRPDEALPLLTRIHAAAVAQRRLRSVIEAGALSALARWATSAGGDDDGVAVGTLASALIDARPQGYVRVFADEGRPMAALVARLAAAQRAGVVATKVPPDYLARIEGSFEAARGGPAQDLIDPLTNRELEVLALLAAGKSNHAIADDLVVSLDTVKKHVSHVLGKLDAGNRTEAVARGRGLGLLD